MGEAAASFDDDVLAAIVLTTIAMNAWNRVAISTHMAAQLALA